MAITPPIWSEFVAAFKRDLPAIMAGRDPMRGWRANKARQAQRDYVHGRVGSLPPGEVRVMRYLQDYFDDFGQMPLHEEIARALSLKRPPSKELQRLADKGYLQKGVRGKKRSIRILKRLP